MSSGKKFILIVFDLLLLFLVVPSAWDYYNLVEYGDMTSASSQVVYIGEFIPVYLFWGNTILAVILIIALLIIAFYPRTYIDIELPTHGGKLTLKRSAIEGLVREKVLENDFLKSPRINVTLYKKKINIDVKGEIIPRVEIAEKSRLLEQEIIDSLKLFFGVDQPVKIKVEVNALNKETNNKRSRVV